jgi:hypothetical protein
MLITVILINLGIKNYTYTQNKLLKAHCGTLWPSLPEKKIRKNLLRTAPHLLVLGSKEKQTIYNQGRWASDVASQNKKTNN